jgi:hypothetical protein
VQDRCRSHISLKDREEDILKAMQREASAVTERYQHLETDSRSRTNIQIAAQTLATHKVLLPYVKNENEVMQMLKEQNGAKSEEGIRYVTVSLLPLWRHGGTMRRGISNSRSNSRRCTSHVILGE